MTTTPSNSPTPSDSASESTNLSFLSEPVKQCIKALAAAETETEKLAALFLVPKLVPECGDRASKYRLMKGIGYSFLARMLRSKDSPGGGCPKLMYQSLALSILSCFSDEPEIMTNPSILFNIPVLLDIINDADDDVYDENLVVIKDAYRCLFSIVSTIKGRNSFISCRGIHYLCKINVQKTFQCETALKLLLYILSSGDGNPWSYHCGVDDFHVIMCKFSTEFAESQDETKFEYCETLRIILKSFPRSYFDSPSWLPSIKRGLRDVLFSKIGKTQRDPAIKLVAAVVEASDFEWCFSEDYSNEEEKGKFFMILVNLVCIEVIMHLDEKKIEHVLEESELVISCFYVIEGGINYLVNDKLDFVNESKKAQLYSALKNALSTVIKFIQDAVSDEEDSLFSEPKEKYFICAAIRVLSAWLAEETSADRLGIYSVLPHIIRIAVQTFEAQKLEKLKSLPRKGRFDFNSFSEETTSSGKKVELIENPPDTLRFILAALCHLVAEDESRKILLDLKLHDTLYTYATYHWSIFDCYRLWLEGHTHGEPIKDGEGNELAEEPQFIIDQAKFEMVNSKYALTTICNILTNICVLESEFVNSNATFFHALKFIINVLPSIDKNDSSNLVLVGNLSILGLLILKSHENRRPKESDAGVYKFIQSVISFLWDAFNSEESPNGDELRISSSYSDHWGNISDLWFLGMHVIKSLLTEIQWLAEFILESGWPQDILRTLSKVKRGKMVNGSKSIFEDLIVTLLKHPKVGKETFAELKKTDVIGVCQKHSLGSLANFVAASAAKNSIK